MKKEKKNKLFTFLLKYNKSQFTVQQKYCHKKLVLTSFNDVKSGKIYKNMFTMLHRRWFRSVQLYLQPCKVTQYASKILITFSRN